MRYRVTGGETVRDGVRATASEGYTRFQEKDQCGKKGLKEESQLGKELEDEISNATESEEVESWSKF